MPLIKTLRLIHVESNKGRDADLYSPIEKNHFDEYDQWLPFIEKQLGQSIKKLSNKELDRLNLRGWHWQWRGKTEQRNEHGLRSFALVCDGETQGLMLAELEGLCRLEEKGVQKLVYINLLATAPWNRPAFVRVSRYKGIGTMMIRAAIELSVEQKCNGRIGLHSLESATEFYEKCGMITRGPDLSYENLPYYEMTAEAAEQFLQKFA